MSNLDNFKDIADNRLKDIKVSEELKERTLQRCKKESSTRRRVVIPYAAIGVAAVLTLIMVNFRFIPIGNNQGEGSPQIMIGTQESGNSTMAQGPAVNNHNNTNPDSAASDTSIFQAPEGNGDISSANSVEPFEGTGVPLYQPGTINEAKAYLGEDFKMPQYIPSGFKQSLVQVPTDMKKEGMDIMISYERGSEFFTIIMRKGATSLDHFIGNKEIDINGAKAQVTSGPLMAGTQEISPFYTQMRWLSNDVLYMIDGQIEEEEAVKVATSIK